MATIDELSVQAKDSLAVILERSLVFANNDQFAPKQRLDGLKVAISAAQTILDRTDPKLTASHEIRTDMTNVVKSLASVLSPGEAKRALKEIEVKLLPKSNAGAPRRDR